MTTIVIADSRGRDLLQNLEEYKDIGTFLVISHSGKGYNAALNASINQIRLTKPERIIVMLGICTITKRDPITKQTFLRSTEVQELVTNVMTEIRNTYQIIQGLHACQVSYATVTGLDIADYNNYRRKFMDEKQYNLYCLTTKTLHPQQVTLDKIILELNRRITAFNQSNNIPTTWTATAIHAYHNKKYHHYYKKLYDGCHPTKATIKYWAKQIVRVVRRMIIK